MKIYLVTNQMKLRFIFRVTFTTSKLCIQTFCIFAFYFYHSGHRQFKEVEFFSSKILRSVFDTEKFDVYRTRAFVFVSCCLSPPKPNRKKNWELFCNGTFWNKYLPETSKYLPQKCRVELWYSIRLNFNQKKSLWFKISQRKVIEITKKWNVLPFHRGIFQHIPKINIVWKLEIWFPIFYFSLIFFI